MVCIRFTQRVGKLAIDYRDGDTVATMLFERMPPKREQAH